MTPAQLAQTTFKVGSVADTVQVRVNDGYAWSAWKTITIKPPVNHAPTVAAPASVQAASQTQLAASALFATADSDPTDAIVAYQFKDLTPNAASGHFTIDGVLQNAGSVIDVTPAQFARTTFDVGGVADTVQVRVSDGTAWSGWKTITIKPIVDDSPEPLDYDARLLTVHDDDERDRGSASDRSRNPEPYELSSLDGLTESWSAAAPESGVGAIVIDPIDPAELISLIREGNIQLPVRTQPRSAEPSETFVFDETTGDLLMATDELRPDAQPPVLIDNVGEEWVLWPSNGAGAEPAYPPAPRVWTER